MNDDAREHALNVYGLLSTDSGIVIKELRKSKIQSIIPTLVSVFRYVYLYMQLLCLISN